MTVIVNFYGYVCYIKIINAYCKVLSELVLSHKIKCHGFGSCLKKIVHKTSLV